MKADKLHVTMILAAMTTLILAVPAAGQDCQVPLFVQEGQVEANVMILFDNSGSMNEAMYPSEYDPFTDWDGDYTRTNMYYVGSDGFYTRDGATAYLVSAPNGQSGRYRGNYLNWIFYHATEEQRDAIPRETRMDVAHEVVTDIIDRSRNIRFGLANFYTSEGGYIKAECGTDKVDLIHAVDSIAGTTWTPLAETMEDVLNYFRKTGSGAPILAKCQKSFLIVMTDGFPTQDLSISGYLVDADGDGNDPGNCESIGAYGQSNSDNCSDHMDDVAYWMRHNDLRDDLGDPGESWEDGQNIVTYTVGFGIDAYLLHETAENGDGLYLLAQNAAELWSSLELIMLDIISRISSGSAVAVVSTERGHQDFLYRGKFMPGDWNGYLESFALPYEDGDIPTWEAGYRLAQRSADDREIFTGLGSTAYNFTAGQAASLWSTMGAASVNEAAGVISWCRGENVWPHRERESHWKLGDIIHSTPVVVGAPSNFTEDESYQDFMDHHANREKVVYVGSNDGMLHAFEADNGWEKWAFVPEFSLPLLADIADTNYCHKYSCDLTPSVKDIKLNNTWSTVLVSGGREGSSGYFALDITYPNSPDLLWQIDLPNHKSFSSEVEFATIDGEPVALIGSGVDNTTGQAFLYEYDMESGALLGSLQLSSVAGGRNKATAATTVDLDLDGNDDLAYIGDLQGSVYRIKFNDSRSPGSWSVTELYSGSQPVSARPMAAYGEGGDIHVYFGTGSYIESDDLDDTSMQSFYCVFDRHDGNESPQLENQTWSIHDVGSADGWYIDLHETGERVTEPAIVVAGAVFFTTYAPSCEPCEAGGHSWLYRVAYDDGSVPDDGEDDGFDGDRRIDMGEGVASRPVVDIVNENVIVQSSDATITVEAMGQAFFHLDVRSWQETYDTDPPTQTEPPQDIQ